MDHYTGSFIEINQFLETKSNFQSTKRYFNDFLDAFGLQKADGTRANIFTCDVGGNKKKIYFAGADKTFWWGFSKTVIQKAGVNYLLARGENSNGVFYIVIEVDLNKKLFEGDGRILVSAGGKGKDFWVTFGDGTYKSAQPKKTAATQIPAFMVKHAALGGNFATCLQPNNQTKRTPLQKGGA